MASRAELRRVLTVLCLSEITSYGVLYYAFPVMATRISVQTGWSTAAFTTGLFASGLIGIPVGRWLDRYGPRVVMTSGSVLGVAALVLIATAPSLLWFFVAWLLAGTAMAGVFYAPAFTALTREPRHPRRIRPMRDTPTRHGSGPARKFSAAVVFEQVGGNAPGISADSRNPGDA